MDLGLRDRVYIVTGGTSGLGRATAASLVADGARVLVSGRSAESVDRACRELGDAVIGVVADNADPATPELLVGKAEETFGRLDGLLVSVGGPPKGRIADVADEQWRASFESIVLGTVRLVRAVASRLQPSGAIAVVLSSSVRAPIPDLTISNVFRPGLAMLVKQLADEFGPSGIRVVSLAPGRIATARTDELDAGNPGARQRSEASMPLRRLGDPAEFGRVAAFVLSPAASYVSGSVVSVDGGMIRGI